MPMCCWCQLQFDPLKSAIDPGGNMWVNPPSLRRQFTHKNTLPRGDSIDIRSTNQLCRLIHMEMIRFAGILMIWTVWSLDLCHFCGYRYNIYLLKLYILITCICLHKFVAWIWCNDFQAWLEGCFASTGVCRRERSQKREVHQRGERVKVRCSSDNRTLYMKQVCLWAMLAHNVSIVFHIYCIILCKYMIRHQKCLMFGKLWLYEQFQWRSPSVYDSCKSEMGIVFEWLVAADHSIKLHTYF